jgi:peptidoglycan/xylan/chitin deacetylase (PgdA/CDA1 family)
MRIHRATRRTGFLAAILLALGLLVVAPAPEAAAAVQSCSSSTPVASRPTLRYGDTGSCVKVLQNLLLAKGFSIGTSYADGKFGPGTLLGVRRYQQSRLDLAIDGVVGPYTWNRLVNGGGTAYSAYRGPNTSSRVILSFDDCPTSLSAFKATVVGARNLGIALVLAPTGNCISAGRFNASYARQYGHWVINHSVSHPDYTTLSTSSIYYQLGSPGVVTSYGRPPYGAVNERVRNAFATKGMRIWLWNVDTNDWRGKTRSQVVSYVVTYAKPGNTVLMHMHWNGFNTTALSSMKSGLAAKGIGVCRNLGATTPTRPSKVNC